MKNMTFRKQLTIFVFCTVVLTGCVLLGFLIDRSITANNLFGKIIGILAPFIAGGIIAFILKPLCNLLAKPIGKLFIKKVFRRSLERGSTTERRVLKRADNVSIFLSVLIFFLIIAALLFAVIPQLYDSIVRLVNSIPGWIESFAAWLGRFIGEDNQELNQSIQEQLDKLSSGLIKWLTTAVQPALEDLLSGNVTSIFSKLSPMVTVGRRIVSALLNVVVSVVVIVYTLANRKKFAKQGVLIVNAIFPDKWSKIILEECSYADRVFSGFISGRMIDSLLVGVLIFIATTIFGIPQAILISILMGMSQIIPFFGPYIGAIPSCLIILMIDPIKVIYFLILVIVIQQLDANIFDPLIVGNSIEMSSFWVLFSVILFGGLFQFPGLLIGVPTFTILYDIVRKLTDFLLKKRGKEELAEEYRRHYHNPSDDPGLLRENARKFRRDRRHTKAEQKRITELVAEARESGTTEAAVPLMTVIDAETPDEAEESVAAAEPAVTDTLSDESVQNPSPAAQENAPSAKAEDAADAPADVETPSGKTE